MEAFIYRREDDVLAIYDLQRGHGAGPVAVVHDSDYLDIVLVALNRSRVHMPRARQLETI